MLKLLFLAAFLQCTISQQYQQKVAPGVPPQNYQNYQQPPPPPPPQQQQYQQQQQQQQYQQPPPPQQQQYQPPPPQQQQQQQFQQQQQPPQQFQQQQQQGHGHAHHGDPQLLNPANIAQERDHIQEHMDVPIDTSKMSEQELQFHYFKMHDADNNNKLDGCELIKSLIHWHVNENDGVASIKDRDLEVMTDRTLKEMDLNDDGFISWGEYKKRHDEYQSQVDKNHKSYTDGQLEELLEHVFKHTDIDKDGYVDYMEYKISNFKAKVAEKKAAAAAAAK